jgi:hypothetical protein
MTLEQLKDNIAAYYGEYKNDFVRDTAYAYLEKYPNDYEKLWKEIIRTCSYIYNKPPDVYFFEIANRKVRELNKDDDWLMKEIRKAE